MDTLGALPLSWLDWTLLAVVCVSMLVGLLRGLVFECLSLAGWVVAWFAAHWLSSWLAPSIPLGLPGSPLNSGLAFGLVFVGVLLAWTLMARLLRMLIHATPLSLPDRLLGAGFGCLRGLVLLLALSSLVALTPAAQSSAWRGSHAARWLGLASLALKPLLPPTAARFLPA